jgi:nucleotide-binding universal stress UspA family protein
MYKRIFVAIDGSDTGRLARDAAFDLAQEQDATLRAAYILADPPVYWDAPGYDPSIVRNALAEEGALLKAETAALMDARHIRGDACVVEAAVFEDVAECIVKAARDFGADVLVLGTHGRRGVRRLMLGSVAERCLRLAALPVLLIPGRVTGHDSTIAQSTTHAPQADTAAQ